MLASPDPALEAREPMDGVSRVPITAVDRAPTGYGLVPRRLLLRRLSAVAPGGVLVVQGPAGSGKTVLVRSWVEEEEGLADRVAWLSVECCERDAQRFWSSLAGELAAAAGRGELDEPSESAVVLVIDDLHELRCPDALERLELLLSSLPPNMRVVLVTREDPQLRLHRLRLERRAHRDPRRGPALLARGDAGPTARRRDNPLRSRLDLAPRAYRGMGGRSATGGDLAGPTSGPGAFRGRVLRERAHRRGLPSTRWSPASRPRFRDLLLRTSILEKVSGPLADALTGGSRSERILQQLEDAGAFVSSLDAGRKWFRYHPLFADLLRLELRRTSPMLVSTLHRTAARWYEENGDVIPAVRHAQAAGDWAFAARLLAEHHLSLVLAGRAVTASKLLAAFPEEAATADPELALVLACARALEGRLGESARYVDVAQRLAAAVPRDRSRHFQLLMANARIWQANLLRDTGAALEAERMLEAALQPQPASPLSLGRDLRATALTYRGVIELSPAEAETARRDLERALELARRAGRPWLEIVCLAHLAAVAQMSGRLALALGLARKAVAMAEAHDWQEQPVAAPAFAMGAETLSWLGRLEEAECWLERGGSARAAQGEPGADPGTELVLHHARGLLCLGQGRLDQALEAFRTAERTRTQLAGDHALPGDVLGRVLRTQVLMGETAAARAALAEVGEPQRGCVGLRLAAASIELADSRPEVAVQMLAPVLEGMAGTVHPPPAGIEALLLSADAHTQLGHGRAADASIERALELAEPESVVLPFALVPILHERDVRGGTAHASLRSMICDLLAGSSPRLVDEGRKPCEELSDAELRVVRFLPSNLNVPEIASELFVSANTARTHLRHIYAKLGVHNRTQAVARARELQLVGPCARQR